MANSGGRLPKIWQQIRSASALFTATSPLWRKKGFSNAACGKEQEYSFRTAGSDAADFFGDFVSGPVVFQTELNQNSLGARKMFPFLVFSCGRTCMIHSDDSFGDC